MKIRGLLVSGKAMSRPWRVSGEDWRMDMFLPSRHICWMPGPGVWDMHVNDGVQTRGG